MANEKDPQPVVTGIPYEVYQRQKLAEELKNAPKLDVTQPGGYYLDENGQAVDANGKPVKAGKKASAAGEQETATLDDVDLTPAARTKADELKLTAEDFKRKRAGGASGDFTVEDVERIAEAKAKG